MAARVLVTGAGGFIGHHLVKFLVDEGNSYVVGNGGRGRLHE
jgi:nucleoside-diphosphate-sugar epimerase